MPRRLSRRRGRRDDQSQKSPPPGFLQHLSLKWWYMADGKTDQQCPWGRFGLHGGGRSGRGGGGDGTEAQKGKRGGVGGGRCTGGGGRRRRARSGVLVTDAHIERCFFDCVEVVTVLWSVARLISVRFSNNPQVVVWGIMKAPVSYLCR